ncbi:hypothetical protein LZK98_10395 [Sphingomonas cannabina]|uniref:hypothetical protein n=1 Tax=Sphingomonas cannabina TaxID=2899123 RepID=UPI001F15FF73|nr:hypothetical protein [Sphingomonas cannabina]UIJ43514.1 hypothetical protein LZK98_10395 [Sphingomonas cannabina]
MVRRAWMLVLLLLATSLVTTAVVHARELQVPVTLECTGEVHSADDRDQSTGDADNGLPHHHGTCQGPALALPSKDDAPGVLLVASARPTAAASRALVSHPVDPALRPPNA